MKINRMSLDSSVKYSATFYDKMKAEQKRYMEKVKTDKEKEKKCLMEEVDCQSSVGTLRYNEPKFKYQDIPVRKRKETIDKQQIKKLSENPSSEKIPPKLKINSDQEELCVIEEIDCKLSLIDIGYVESEDEVKTVDENMYELENNALAETYGRSVDISGTNVVDSEDVQLIKYLPEYDINNYFSSSIIASVEDYTIDKDNTKETLIINEDEDEDEVEDEDENEDEDMKENQNIEIDDNTEANSVYQEEINTENRNNIIQKVGYFLKKVLNAKKVIHTEAIYLENKLGFLSLISLLGLFGIFTNNKVCLGFVGFLYFTRYFLVMPDESFKTSLRKAAAPAFLTNIIFSVLTIVLWLLINDAVLFPIGLGTGMAVSVIVFTVILAACGKKKMAITKNEITL